MLLPRPRPSSLVAAFATAAAVGAGAPSAGAAPGERTVTQLPTESTLRADGDRLLTSAFDPADRAYHLTVVEGGVATRLPLAPAAAPIQADFGRDAQGRAAVVLARCSGGRLRRARPPPGRGG